MDAAQAIILGIVQGLTEFLPISSSAHLVLTETLLGLKMPGVSFEVWLHFGTLVAVLIYFRAELLAMAKAIFRPATGQASHHTLFWSLVIGTVPAVLVGFTLKSAIEEAFASPRFAAAMLLVTGIILLSSALARNRNRPVSLLRGLLIGVAQAIAILPGISRSGSTISMGLFLGMEPAAAAQFSFLLSIPAIGGAFVLDMASAGGQFLPAGSVGMYLLGAAVSFMFGLISIHYLLKIMRKGKFFIFGLYCLAVGTVALILLGR